MSRSMEGRERVRGAGGAALSVLLMATAAGCVGEMPRDDRVNLARQGIVFGTG